MGDYVGAQEPVSDLLANWKARNPQELKAVVSLVYDELRTLAHRYLRKQRPVHSLQSTALVHGSLPSYKKAEESSLR